MKTQKLVNLGLSLALSLIFIHYLINGNILNLLGIGSILGLLCELYFFFNFVFDLIKENKRKNIQEKNEVDNGEKIQD